MEYTIIGIGFSIIASLVGLIYKSLDYRIKASQTKEACEGQIRALTKQFCLKLENIDTKITFLSQEIKEIKEIIKEM